ncbi:MAG: M50 family metallopeptidase [Planctomycetota bacterium]
MELDVTAYHEAGHAVIATMLGGKVIGVTVEPEEDGLYGNTEVAWKQNGVSRKTQLVREIQTLIAGPLTEAIYQGKDEYWEVTEESSGDWLKASQLVSELISGRATQSRILAQQVTEIYQVLNSEKCWNAIAALADELEAHETLDAEAAQEVLEFWLSR